MTTIRVFGSVARGEAGPESDVDLLVEYGPHTSAWFPAGFISDLEELLGWKVDVATVNALHWYIKDRVLAEAVAVGQTAPISADPNRRTVQTSSERVSSIRVGARIVAVNDSIDAIEN